MWTLYKPPVELPFPAQEVGKTHPFPPEQHGDPTAVIELRAGETLYLPRGTPHVARAGSDTHSLHLTLTVASAEFAWGALLEGALRELYLRDDAFREALPVARFHPGASSNTEEEARTRAHFTKLKQRARENLNFGDALASFQKKMAATRLGQDREREEYLGHRQHQTSISIHSPVTRRQAVKCEVQATKEGAHIAVKCGERGFNLLPKGRPGLDYALAAQDSFKIGSIPGEDPFFKVFLAKQLLNMGVLSHA